MEAHRDARSLAHDWRTASATERQFQELAGRRIHRPALTDRTDPSALFIGEGLTDVKPGCRGGRLADHHKTAITGP
jgi:hypothetical protein